MIPNSIQIPGISALGIGGPRSFLASLARELLARGISVDTSDQFQDCDALLFAISCKEKLVERYRERRKPAIQRLDGVYYWSKHRFAAWRNNSVIRSFYRRSTHKVFQSRYSREVCRVVFGSLPERSQCVILNGIDETRFYPASANALKSRNVRVLKFVTTGNFRNADMLVPIADALAIVEDRIGIPFLLNVVGPVSPRVQRIVGKRPYLRYKGVMDSCGVAEELRQGDIFLFSSLNPPCPNSVLEAVATGLPVVAFDDGSMPEILSHQAELLAPSGAGLFRTARSLSPAGYADCILTAINNLGRLRNVALRASKNFSIRRCAAKYLDFIQAAIKSLEVNC